MKVTLAKELELIHAEWEPKGSSAAAVALDLPRGGTPLGGARGAPGTPSGSSVHSYVVTPNGSKVRRLPPVSDPPRPPSVLAPTPPGSVLAATPPAMQRVQSAPSIGDTKNRGKPDPLGLAPKPWQADGRFRDFRQNAYVCPPQGGFINGW